MFSFSHRFRFFATLVIGMIGTVTGVEVTNAAYHWQTIGDAHFTGYTTDGFSFAISPAGIPYVAYQNVASDYKANVWKFTDSSWSAVGSADFSDGRANSISLAIDTNGIPYVGYIDVASSSRATVKKFNGSSWVTVGNRAFSTSSIQDINLAISPTGTPYVAFVDPSNNDAATIMTLSGATWTAVGTPYTTARAGGLSIVVAPDGKPYVAFSNLDSGAPVIITPSGSGWGTVGDISINLLGNCPIAVSPTGTLYIAVSDVANGSPQVYRFNGSSWGQVASTFATTTAGQFNIAVGSTGVPYVSFTNPDTASAMVISPTSSGWGFVGDPLFTSTTYGGVAPLAINPYGKPYVAYSDDTLSDYRLTVMAYLNQPDQVRSLTAQSQTPSVAALSWAAPADSGGLDIIGYKIERESPAGSGFTTLIDNAASTNLSYSDTSLRASTGYNYRVSAISTLGVGTVTTVAVTTQAVAASMMVAPTASGVSGSSPLTLTLNGGAKSTNSPMITLGLNANPQTIRGYVASLDLTFPQASIFPLSANDTPPTFTLPETPGTYTIYLKYYSISGIFSAPLSQTITYSNISSAPAATAESISFKRTLKVGSAGADVKALQQFLNAHGFVVAKQGPGSPGQETALFGPATLQALSAFQNAHAETILKPLGLNKGTGIFGPSTMRLVNGMG